MAGKKLTASNNEQATQGFSFGRSGNTLRTQGELKVTTFQLREVEDDPVKGRSYGRAVTGKEAIDIVTTHNSAHAEQILQRLEKDIISFKSQAEVTPVTRNVASGESVQERASRYIRGIVLGAVNTCPTKLTVSGKTYLYEKRSISKALNPEDVISIINNAAYVGSQQGTKAEFLETDENFNTKCITQELFERALSMFCEKLRPRLEGEKLYLDDKNVAMFATIDDTATVIQGASAFDENSVSVKFF